MSSEKKLKAKFASPSPPPAPTEVPIDLGTVEEVEETLAPVVLAPVVLASVASSRKPKRPKVKSQPLPLVESNGKAYRHSTTEEKTALFRQRQERIAEQEPKVGDAKKALRDVIKGYMADPSESNLYAVLEANTAVQTEDCKLSDIVKNPRTFFEYKGLLQRDLMFDLYRQNKTAEPVGSVHANTFPAEFFFVEGVPTQAKIEVAQLVNPEVANEGTEPDERQLGGTIRTYSSRQIGAIIAAKKAHRF